MTGRISGTESIAVKIEIVSQNYDLACRTEHVPLFSINYMYIEENIQTREYIQYPVLPSTYRPRYGNYNYYIPMIQMLYERADTPVPPSLQFTVIPLRSLVIRSTLREELLAGPLTSVRDDPNLPPGPQVAVSGITLEYAHCVSTPLALTIHRVTTLSTTHVNVTLSLGHISSEGGEND